MNMRWHRIVLSCPHCEGEVNILSFSASGDGEVRLDLYCVKCAKDLTWVSTSNRLVSTAIYKDIEESQTKKEHKAVHKPIRPPLKNAKEKTDDTEWLHSLGISDEGE